MKISNLSNLREQLQTDDDLVLDEFKKLQVLFELKRVIRYHHTREELFDTESVAEHVYGILCLIEYFLPLEDINGKWDKNKIVQMAIFHDVDEIITGDKIGYLKTKKDIDAERFAQDKLIQKLPEVMQRYSSLVLDEYDQQITNESKFVKALDKLEPVFHLFNKNGKRILLANRTTVEQHRVIKDKYMTSFPLIKRFNDVMRNRMQLEGFYYEE